MWQLTIIGNSKFNLFLKHIELVLKSKTKAVLAKNKNQLSIACVLKDKVNVLKVLNRVLSENLVLFYKENFILKTLDLNYLSETFKQALIKCLVLLDFETDVNFVFNQLSLWCAETINLDSFCHFKLKVLKQHWQTNLDVVNSSSAFIESDTFLDVLKFLVSAITPKRQSVDVCYSAGKFVISDENNNVLVFNNSGNDELNLISGLITLAPQTINLYCASALTNKTFKLIYYIFNKKVNLLV